MPLGADAAVDPAASSFQDILPQLLGRHLEGRHLEAPQGVPAVTGRAGHRPCERGDARQAADLEPVLRLVSAVAPGDHSRGAKLGEKVLTS